MGAGLKSSEDGSAVIMNGGVDRIKIGPEGQFSPDGVNFGVLGQMIVSRGPGASAQWQTVPFVKTDVDQLFTKPQRTDPLTISTASFDIGATGSQDFFLTMTGAGTLTFTNIRKGMSGTILLINPGNYAVAKASTIKCPINMLSTISTTGRYRLAYSCTDGTNVDVTSSAALS